MPTKIDFDTATLGEILNNNKNLEVPISQRSYAWKREHVTDLLKDLNGAITKGTDEYFLGAIIVLPSPVLISVYDGQQRLATTTVLIAAIRDYFVGLGDTTTADTITSDSLLSIDRRTHELRPHLKLNVDDNQFFVDRVLRRPADPIRSALQPDPNKESHTLIDAAARTATEYVRTLTSTLSAPDAVALLHKWLDFLSGGARVIWVEVGDEQTAFRVFETMNDRGLKLSAADLLKNFLFASSGSRKTEVIQRWQSMVATLESLGKEDGDVVDYIRYFWVTTHGPTRVNDLFDLIKAEITNEGGALALASDLEIRSDDYVAILTPSHDAWSTYHQEVRATISTLRYLGVSQIRPLLLAAFGRFEKGEMQKLFKLSVNWSVRFLVVGFPSGTLEGFYSRTAKKISENLITTTEDVSRELSEIIPTDEAFESAFKTITVPTASLARYYLRRLQIQADGNTEPQYTPNEGQAVTLEHILPQRPSQEWDYIGAEAAKANYNRLGNQALLAGSVNSRLGNVGFSTKKIGLKESPFSLTSTVADQDNWTIDMIAERQTQMARLAVLAWPLT